MVQKRQERQKSYSRQVNQQNVLARAEEERRSVENKVPERYSKYSIQTLGKHCSVHHNRTATHQYTLEDCSCLSDDSDDSCCQQFMQQYDGVEGGEEENGREQYSYSSISEMSCCG